MSDPYCYPGTSVLRNLADLHDPADLARFERLMTYARMTEPVSPTALDARGYLALHRHIFQDVYAWAGELRTVDLARGASTFCRAAYLEQELAKRLVLVANETGLADRRHFALRAAAHAGEINALHPFRDGNGRTLRLFLKLWAQRNGHGFAIRRIERGAWLEASVASFERQDYRGLQDVIAGALTELR